MGGSVNLPEWWVSILNHPRPHRLHAETEYSRTDETCEVCWWLAKRLWVRHKAEQYGRLEPASVEIEELHPATKDTEALSYGMRQIYSCVRRLCLDGILLVLPAEQFGEVVYHVNEVRDK